MLWQTRLMNPLNWLKCLLLHYTYEPITELDFMIIFFELWPFLPRVDWSDQYIAIMAVEYLTSTCSICKTVRVEQSFWIPHQTDVITELNVIIGKYNDPCKHKDSAKTVKLYFYLGKHINPPPPTLPPPSGVIQCKCAGAVAVPGTAQYGVVWWGSQIKQKQHSGMERLVCPAP